MFASRSVGRLGSLAAVCAVACTRVAQPTFAASSYGPCDAVGDGLRGEIWKRKHDNLNILELEDNEIVTRLMTVLRNKDTPTEEFRAVADRVLAYVMEAVVAGLDDEEVTVQTDSGVEYTGPVTELGEVAAVGIKSGCAAAEAALRATIPAVSVYSANFTKSADGQKEVADTDLPKHLKGVNTVVLLAPVLPSAQAVSAMMEELASRGVPAEKVVIACLTLSPEAAEELTKRGLNVVSASIEAGRGPSGNLLPGLGHFATRYGGAERA